MSFSLFESSRTKAAPFHLYTVRYGAETALSYYMTDNDVPVVVADRTYQPRTIQHAEITANGSLDKSSFDLMAPRTNELFELFRVSPPTHNVYLKVERAHNGADINDRVSIWNGRIISMTVQGSECTFTCEVYATKARRLGLRRNWQIACPHPLYGAGCYASKFAVQQVARNLGLIDGKVRMSEGWNGPLIPEKYIGGFVTIADKIGFVWTILRVEGNMLTLSGDVTKLPRNVDLYVYPGCNHDMADCKGVHNNLPNYGGQPWIPLENPFGNRNNFY